jgi:YVTN family beta-propeller protein
LPETPKRNIDFPAAYVVNADNSISVINLLTLEVDTTFLIPSTGNSFAHHIYKSPDNQQLVVALPSVDLSNGHGQLHSINATGGVATLSSKDGSLISRVTAAAANHNAIFSPDGTEIWTGLMSHDLPKVSVYNASDLKLKVEIQVGTDASEVTFSSDGKTAFVAAQEGSFVYAIDVQSKEVVKQIKVDFFPTNVWPGNGRVFVENKNRPSINIIDSHSKTTTSAIDLDFSPGFTVFHEQSSTIWVCDGENAQVRIFTAVGSEWEQAGKLRLDQDSHAIAFSDKYNLALVVNQGANNVSVIDLSKKEVIKKITVGLKPNGIVMID